MVLYRANIRAGYKAGPDSCNKGSAFSFGAAFVDAYNRNDEALAQSDLQNAS